MYPVNNWHRHQRTAYDVNIAESVAKTALGQLADVASPVAGLACHSLLFATARNPLDTVLGAIGLGGSIYKLLQESIAR